MDQRETRIVIEYGRPPRPWPSRVRAWLERHGLFAFCMVLLLGTFVALVYLEYLNWRAGGVLPRHGEGGKWRQLAAVEGIWRDMQHIPRSAPLTAAQRDALQAWLEKTRAANALHSGSTLVCMGPLLVPLLAVYGFITDARNRRRWYVAAVLAMVAMMLLIAYRGYWTAGMNFLY